MDPQEVSNDEPVSQPRKRYERRYVRSNAIKGYTEPKPSQVNKASPLTYKKRSVLTANPYNPLTIVKPLVPNILDKALVDSVNMDMARKKASGYEWGVVAGK